MRELLDLLAHPLEGGRGCEDCVGGGFVHGEGGFAKAFADEVEEGVAGYGGRCEGGCICIIAVVVVVVIIVCDVIIGFFSCMTNKNRVLCLGFDAFEAIISVVVVALEGARCSETTIVPPSG